MPKEELGALAQQESNMIDLFDNSKHYELDPESLKKKDNPTAHKEHARTLLGASGSTGPMGATGYMPPTVVGVTGPTGSAGHTFRPIVTPEEEDVIKKFFDANPQLKADKESIDNSRYVTSVFVEGNDRTYKYDPDVEWIQTYSGRRFCPTNPNPDAIVIQDIAHSLAMQCRFSGHVKKFYSVAQHSVLVSYICDSADALWGLMHDASEAYLVDVPRPLKRSGKFDAYLRFEAEMQRAVCTRFGLPEKEPPSVKRADTILLATEARDLMSPLHPDWTQACDPLPFKIDPLPPDKAKDLFMKRFFELTGMPGAYEHYLDYEYNNS
jgi:5'-deoxynucleotidase YfbR-like HD superfamily hydrolase